MPEVIDLLSSSPPRQPDVSKSSRLLHSPSPEPEIVLVDDEIYSSFDYGNYEKPVKRRRLSDNRTARGQPERYRVSTTTSMFEFSDDEFVSASKRVSNVKCSVWNVDESDSILSVSHLSSSPHRVVDAQKPRRHVTESSTSDERHELVQDDGYNFFEDDQFGTIDVDDLSDDNFNFPELDELIEISATQKVSSGSFSGRTATILQNLEKQSEKKKKKVVVSKRRSGVQGGKNGVPPAQDNGKVLDDLDIEPSKLKRQPKLSAEEMEAKARERQAAKAEREWEKQLEKERKQKLKDDKAKEKQLAADISEVNKLKLDKKISTPEMIVDVASTLNDTSVGNQTAEIMRSLGVDFNFFQSAIPNVVKWRRKVVAKYNEALGYWEPCTHHIMDENHVMCLVPAQDFVEMVVASTDSSDADCLETHLLKMRSAYPGCKLIYLIEGLTTWMRKNQNSRNRAYQTAVRRQLNEEVELPRSSQSRRKADRKPESTPAVDDDTIEDALLQLQVTHGCLIYQTNVAPESAEWIKNFTEHISQIPYRKERELGNDAAFCMETGQVKTGDDKQDTFVKMLQEVNRVTASMVYGIVTKYPTVIDLVKAMRVHGPLLLEDVKKCSNKDGTLSDSRIGPCVSKRLYKVFMGLDPSSTDI